MSDLYFRAVAYHALGLELSVPDPEQVRAAYGSGKCKEFPYWSRIWASSLALGSWLKEHPNLIAGKDILEIGAGIGLPSFIASSYASSVTVSDHIPEAIAWIDLNISNRRYLNMKSRLVDWSTRPLPDAEVILLSDIGYDEEDFSAIREMIGQYIRSGSLILMSVPFRIMSARFVQLIEEFVINRTIITVMEKEILVLQLGSTDSL
jgi:predicted nicotinamide N-methyase